MFISKENLECLLTSRIETGILLPNYKHAKYTWSELLTELDEEHKSFNVHFKYHTYTDATTQGEYTEIIEFTLNDTDLQNNLPFYEWAEEKTHVGKNALYRIIEVLKEL